MNTNSQHLNNLFHVTILFMLSVTSVCNGQTPPFANFGTNFTGTSNLIVSVNTTIPLPTNGVLHFNDITVNDGATLSFTPNELNTPVYLMAKGDIVVNGTIDVSGKPGVRSTPGEGGPGGFGGGYGAFAGGVQSIPGNGKGPGGGAITTIGGSSGRFDYGNALCVPLVGGSGGAGGQIFGNNYGGGGGGGGGAIQLAARGQIVINGNILARNGAGSPGSNNVRYGGGSGSAGAIRLVAPLITGAGTLDVTGPNGTGRIRIDSADRDAAKNILSRPANVASSTRGSQDILFPEANNLVIASVTIDGVVHTPIPTEPKIIPTDPGADTTAVVSILAEGRFYDRNDVPIVVVVSPENGASSNYNAVINLQNESGSTEVSVVLPGGTTSTLHAWTRNESQ